VPNLTPESPSALSPLVRRVVANNPGLMTGPGTNTYLVGIDEVAVIDPGPQSDTHLDVLLRMVGDRLRWILCTHTHIDHSPGALALKAATGAELIGMRAPSDGRQDTGFAPDREPAHGERLDLGGVRLRALHTPGHASNHLCYLLEETRMLFTGDHVMQGSTVVINPPDGDMRVYLASLERLLHLACESARVMCQHMEQLCGDYYDLGRNFAMLCKYEETLQVSNVGRA
jgi:glyoxylase-like metal-dependent hydrolase (beta-lactamase superfamily II)